MATSVTNPDSVAPSAPGVLTAVGWVEFGVSCRGVRRPTTWVLRATTCIGDERRFHAVGGEPDWAADGALLHRQCGGGDVLLSGDRRGCGRQSGAGFERGVDRGWRYGVRRRCRVRWRRWVLLGGRRCPGRRRLTTLVWCATTSIAAPAPALRPRSRTGSRSRRRRAMWIPRRRAATSTRSPPRTRPATSAPSRTRRRRRCWRTRPRPASRSGLPARLSAAPSTSAGLPPRTTSVSLATTCTAPPRPASHPALANRIAQPTGPSYADTGLATGSYFYKVTAEDAAGNISAASNEATATVADATAPTAPSSLAASVAGSTVNLSWAAATDNVGVSRYNLHRGTTSGFSPSPANRIAQPTGLSYADTGVTPGSYFYKLTAEDAAGNISPVSNTASATVLDTQPAQHTDKPRRHRRRRPDKPHLDRRHRQRRRQPLQPPPRHHRRLHTQRGQPDRATHHHQLHRHRPRRRHLLLQADRRRRRRQHQPRLNEATATVSAPPVTGLVAAYGFDTGTGTTTPDQSGTGNNGTLTNATWTTTSKYGKHSPSTAPTPGHHPRRRQPRPHHRHDPRSLGAADRRQLLDAILKEQSGELVYGVYASTTRTDRQSRSAGIVTRARRHERASRRDLEPSRGDLRRRHPAALRQRRPGRSSRRPARSRPRRRPGSAVTVSGGVVQRPDRRGPGLQPRVERGRGPDRHEPQRDTRTTRADRDHDDPRAGAAGHPVGTRRRPVQRADGPGDDHHFDLRAARPASAVVPRPSPTTRHERRDAHAAGGAHYGTTYTVASRAAPAAWPTAGNALAADPTWTFSTEASPPPILVVGLDRGTRSRCTSPRSCGTRA